MATLEIEDKVYAEVERYFVTNQINITINDAATVLLASVIIGINQFDQEGRLVNLDYELTSSAGIIGLSSGTLEQIYAMLDNRKYLYAMLGHFMNNF